ncbi:protein deglycase [Malassezia cuniculi]|uniref:D-lactate dehydratase n=1 Tax=Malassezia cuniculi TaxID=948313 RepID=A0AAF0J634_9BASI|nr:protein deglycase [Malassezia cuniculi]
MSAAVFLAEGTEEMEFAIAYDVLVRGGINVTSVYVPASSAPPSPESGVVRASRGVRIAPDTTLEEIVRKDLLDSFDAYVVPGGVGGAATISGNEIVLDALRRAHGSGKVVGAICAGSLAVLQAGIGRGEALTSHPSVADQLRGDYDYREDAVVVAEKLVTSRGPGTSFAFALAIVELLKGADVRAQVAAPMMLLHL